MDQDKELTVVEGEVIGIGVVAVKTPTEVVEKATEMANALAKVITDRKLYKVIQDKKYVMVEGWSTLGGMIGVLPREVSVARLEDGGYEAVVELIRTSDGMVVGRASALCGMDETRWAGREEYARRSMAVTRATGKAYRLGFSWIIKLAGFEPTPAEEIPSDEPQAASAWADHAGPDDMEFVVATGALKKDEHFKHLVMLLNLSPFEPGHKWTPEDADWFLLYRDYREGGANTKSAAAGATQDMNKRKREP